MKRVLIYGDSNVWGDNFLTRIRLEDEKQWPQILQKKLGSNYKILQEGLPGRIAGLEEIDKPYKSGQISFMSTFRTCSPVDIIIIFLGTNDLQIKYNKTPLKIAEDLMWYKKNIELQYSDLEDRKRHFVNNSMPRIIYILPPKFDYLNGAAGIFNEQSENNRIKLQQIFKDRVDDEFIILDDIPLLEDGIHLNEKGHEIIADIVRKQIEEV